MEPNDEIRELLREIRDTQREYLAEYRRVTEKLLVLQQGAVGRQEQIGRISRRMSLGGGVVAVGLLGLLVYILVRYSRMLFGI